MARNENWFVQTVMNSPEHTISRPMVLAIGLTFLLLLRCKFHHIAARTLLDNPRGYLFAVYILF